MKAIYIDRRTGTNDPPAARQPVTAIMSSPVQCVSGPAALDAALRQMASARVRHLVVLDEAGRYTGVVSDREIGAAWASDPNCLTSQSVASVENTLAPVAPTTYIVTAARTMRAGGTDAVAVVDASGAVVGIVTGTDLVGLLARYPSTS